MVNSLEKVIQTFLSFLNEQKFPFFSMGNDTSFVGGKNLSS